MTIALHFVLAPIPNITLTFFLITFFITRNGFYKGWVFISVFVFIVNLYYGFSIFTIIQYLSYLTLLLILLFNYNNRLIGVGIVCIISMWVYIPFMVVMFGYDFVSYFLADLPFTLIYLVNNLLIYIWLEPILRRIYI